MEMTFPQPDDEQAALHEQAARSDHSVRVTESTTRMIEHWAAVLDDLSRS